MQNNQSVEYFICDPCYVIADDSIWKEFVDTFITASNNPDFNGHFTFKDTPVFAHSTAYGDGMFSSNMHTNFPVDAGMIGAIPLSLADIHISKDKLFKTAIAELSSSFYDNGDFVFFTKQGMLVIETDPKDDEDYDDDDDSCDRSDDDDDSEDY